MTAKAETKAKTNNPNGRPCVYCKDPSYQLKADEYIKVCNGEKPKVPFVQELAILLDIDRDTIDDWCDAKNKDDSLEHPLFFRTIKALKNSQELRLLQRTLGRNNPTGAIFQLKVNHKYIETEKRILAGVDDKPVKMEVMIVEDTSVADDAK